VNAWRRNRRLVTALLAVWVAVTFGVAFFARELAFDFFGWPFSFWVAAQGALFVYVGIVVVYNRQMDRIDGDG
jgi:putative solute:sodium symporter small subunit